MRDSIVWFSFGRGTKPVTLRVGGERRVCLEAEALMRELIIEGVEFELGVMHSDPEAASRISSYLEGVRSEVLADVHGKDAHSK